MPLSRHDRRLSGKWFRHVVIGTRRGSKHLSYIITTFDGPRNFLADPSESGRRWSWNFFSKAEDHLIIATLPSCTEFQASDSVGWKVRLKQLASQLQKVWQLSIFLCTESAYAVIHTPTHLWWTMRCPINPSHSSQITPHIVISGLLRGVNKIFTLLWCYAESTSSYRRFEKPIDPTLKLSPWRWNWQVFPKPLYQSTPRTAKTSTYLKYGLERRATDY